MSFHPLSLSISLKVSLKGDQYSTNGVQDFQGHSELAVHSCSDENKTVSKSWADPCVADVQMVTLSVMVSNVQKS